MCIYLKVSFPSDLRPTMSYGCLPRKCDHHCARVCRQFVCTCDYHPGCATNPEDQRVCCEWELMYRPRSNHYAYTDDDAEVDTLTRYFGVQRSLRDPHDPVRFTGINHVPRWLHTDYSSLDMDYSNILREREIMAACRYSGPGTYYNCRSIRPWNRPHREQPPNAGCSRLNKKDEEEARRELLRDKMSFQRSMHI